MRSFLAPWVLRPRALSSSLRRWPLNFLISRPSRISSSSSCSSAPAAASAAALRASASSFSLASAASRTFLAASRRARTSASFLRSAASCRFSYASWRRAFSAASRSLRDGPDSPMVARWSAAAVASTSFFSSSVCSSPSSCSSSPSSPSSSESSARSRRRCSAISSMRALRCSISSADVTNIRRPPPPRPPRLLNLPPRLPKKIGAEIGLGSRLTPQERMTRAANPLHWLPIRLPDALTRSLPSPARAARVARRPRGSLTAATHGA
mmetsp:Transcript_4069/g.11881  ORF Transcript_4069/g.11881 Transcript_4069/m.11881 type:complete len:267 (+) Transcript_4069:97-897(+)